MTARLRDVMALLEEWYDPATAEDWDAVGLVCGDPDQPVERILFAVDPVQTVVDEAVGWDADLLVVHHPLLLSGVHGVPASTPKGRVVHDLLRHGAALYAAHTNADMAEGGVNESLARARGRPGPQVLFPSPRDPRDNGAPLVPHPHVDAGR
ncbi:MAG: Nif3-like dinuclear metal center hexameric protein, partial [Nocardioidaceae bacterium]